MTEQTRILENRIAAITQLYDAKTHHGIDITGYKDSHHVIDYVTAHSDAVVDDYVNDINWTDISSGSYGNYVLLKHPNGYYTMYAHLAYNTVTVRKGQYVRKGDTLGLMGNTGASAGAHLHFEVRKPDGTKIDPYPYLNRQLPDSIAIIYQARTNNKWMPEVSSATNDFAGVISYPITQICAYPTKELRLNYCVHDASTNKWGVNTYSTIEKASVVGKATHRIDAIQFWIPTAYKVKYNILYVKYRAHVMDGGWLPWVTGHDRADAENGYAGIFGRYIDAYEIKLEFD